MAPVDVVILGAFLAYCLASGLAARRAASRGLDDYFLAGRSLPGWKAGISMAATQFAADTPLLVTGMIAVGGVFALWRLWIYALAFLLMGFVLGAAWRRARVLTDAELAELRYGTRLATVLRVAKAIYFGTIFNCAVLAMVLFAATRIAEPFLHWGAWLPASVFDPVAGFVEWSGIVLTADPAGGAAASADNLISLVLVIAVTAMYSTTGGLRAVVATDLVQFALAMIATIAYAWIVVEAIGGLGALPDRLADQYGEGWAREALAFTPSNARDIGWAVVGVVAIQWIAQMNADGTGYLAQRTMACRTDRDAQGAAVVFVVAQILLRSLVWIPLGLGLLILFPADPAAGDPAFVAGREGTYVVGIDALLPAGIRGIMLAAMLAALASTLDSHLNWGASYWTNDLYRRLWCDLWRKQAPSDRALVRVARLSNFVILALAIVVLTQLDSIAEAWHTTLLLGAGMGLPLVLRWLWWRVTAAGELGAIVVSTIAAPVLLATVDDEGVRMLIVAAASTVTVVVAALAGPRTPTDAVVAFYARVRPPGFWGPVATRAGDDPKEPLARLRDGLAATVAGAFAVFCALVAIGGAMVEAPPPTWFPWRWPWLATVAVAGIAAAAVAAWRWRALGAGESQVPRAQVVVRSRP